MFKNDKYVGESENSKVGEIAFKHEMEMKLANVMNKSNKLPDGLEIIEQNEIIIRKLFD